MGPLKNLRAELAAPDYTGLSDADAAARLNAPIVVGRKLVALRDFVYLIFQDTAGAWARLEATAGMTASSEPEMQLRGAAVTVYDYLRNPHVEHIDLDLPASQAAYAALVAAGVWPKSLVDQIAALADVTTTRAAQLGFQGPVTTSLIAMAKRLS